MDEERITQAIVRAMPPLIEALLVMARRGLFFLSLGIVRVSIPLMNQLGVSWPHTSHAALGIGIAVGASWAAVIMLAVAVITRTADAIGVAAAGCLFLVWRVAPALQRWVIASATAQQPGALVLGTIPATLSTAARPYAVSLTERFKAVAVTGASGTGKSTWLTHTVVADVRRGLGVAVIDPKDDLIERILPHIPADRAPDVVLFDATDVERPLGFNPLAGVPPERRSLATSELLAVFRRYFASAWGSRLEHILSNTILALLETPGSTLLDIPPFLLDAARRRAVVSRVENIGVRQFFLGEFDQILRGRGEALEPILNKVGPWITFPELRHILGQPTSSFEVRSLMDEGKILLARLPQGSLGAEISGLLASLLVAKIQLAAHSRVDTPPDQRRPFILYLDEAHNYANSSLERILVEARAFKLGLVVANQYPEQLSRELQLAIARNAATSVQCVLSHGHYGLQVRRLEDAADGLAPLRLTPLPPLPPGDARWAAGLRERSRSRYGRARAEVEELVRATLGAEAGRPPELVDTPRSRAARTSATGRVARRQDVDED